MLKEVMEKLQVTSKVIVLILILMEHAQRVCPTDYIRVQFCAVLILILMEHAQRDNSLCFGDYTSHVLILILMEHAQRVTVLSVHCYR